MSGPTTGNKERLCCPGCWSINITLRRRTGDYWCDRCSNLFKTPLGIREKTGSGSGQIAGRTYRQQLARDALFPAAK